MLKSPFKSRQHYVFDYKPRFYNPRKERLEKLKRQAEAEQNQSSDYEITLDKSNIRDQWARAKSSESDRKTTMRLALIIVILVGIVAWLFELHTLF